ncbi:MAG TPA: N-acetyltransferase [Micromonosporaceae bacterium]|nr:N-acetyltransferase [Micromonosporaceae bacterium]
MDLLIASLADRPDLEPVFESFPDSWPEFMYHDIVSATLFERLLRAHPEMNLVAVDTADPRRPLARACAVPYGWPLDAGADLPDGGYDHIILSGMDDLVHDRPRGTLSAALEITVRPDQRGYGLSGRILGALREQLARLGFTDLVAPVRPNRKHEHQAEPMAAYLARTRDDGMPADPWIRTHIRAGATVVGIANTSMTVAARLDSWRVWTGVPFDVDGPTAVPQALAPVHCDLERDLGVYVEPNVWMRHHLT